MSTPRNPTKAERRALADELGTKMRRWLTTSDADLLVELQAEVPAVTTATREECVRTLTLLHVDKIVGW